MAEKKTKEPLDINSLDRWRALDLFVAALGLIADNKWGSAAELLGVTEEMIEGIDDHNEISEITMVRLKVAADRAKVKWEFGE